jgi:cell division protein FtsA
VIDIGGGTTDYILYVDGVVKQSGVLGVGGDHITNDISMGLRIPMTRAEKLKIEEGSVTLGNCLPGETVLLISFATRRSQRIALPFWRRAAKSKTGAIYTVLYAQ